MMIISNPLRMVSPSKTSKNYTFLIILPSLIVLIKEVTVFNKSFIEYKN